MMLCVAFNVIWLTGGVLRFGVLVCLSVSHTKCVVVPFLEVWVDKLMYIYIAFYIYDDVSLRTRDCR